MTIEMSKEFEKKFYDITDLIQKEFDRNLRKYGSKIQCRRGCSQCCSQIFNITLMDGHIIAEHVKTLPEEKREALKMKAKEYLKVRSQTVDWERDKSEFSLKPRIPCPALGMEGECTIYEARPVICRRFGIPIYDYKSPNKIYACELNFRDGEEIVDGELIPNQTAIGRKWDELKEVLNKDIGNKINYTTIADAILTA